MTHDRYYHERHMMYSVMLVWVFAAAVVGCAETIQQQPTKTAPAPIVLTKPPVGHQRACFISSDTLTCFSRTTLPNGGKRMVVETTPLATKPE